MTGDDDSHVGETGLPDRDLAARAATERYGLPPAPWRWEQVDPGEMFERLSGPADPDDPAGYWLRGRSGPLGWALLDAEGRLVLIQDGGYVSPELAGGVPDGPLARQLADLPRLLAARDIYRHHHLDSVDRLVATAVDDAALDEAVGTLERADLTEGERLALTALVAALARATRPDPEEAVDGQLDLLLSGTGEEDLDALYATLTADRPPAGGAEQADSGVQLAYLRGRSAGRLAEWQLQLVAHAWRDDEIALNYAGRDDLLRLVVDGVRFFPRWQFDQDRRPHPQLARLLAALDGRDVIAADRLMRAPLPEEGGRSPADLLAAGQVDRALHYVRTAGQG